MSVVYETALLVLIKAPADSYLHFKHQNTYYYRRIMGSSTSLILYRFILHVLAHVQTLDVDCWKSHPRVMPIMIRICSNTSVHYTHGIVFCFLDVDGKVIELCRASSGHANDKHVGCWENLGTSRQVQTPVKKLFDLIRKSNRYFCSRETQSLLSLITVLQLIEN